MSHLNAEQLLDAALQLPPAEFEKFFAQLQKLQAKHSKPQVPRLSARESTLLRQINEGVPSQLQKRSAALRRKQLQTRLTRAEQRELEMLIQQMEQLDVERLQRLAELARIRNVSLRDLMQQLGLEPAEPEYA
jgi:hypothetical protein